MIWRNFLRDLRQTAPRLISVMVITMIAVMVYTALNGVLYHVQQVTAAYGQTQNVADYWISGAGLDRSDCRVLEQIDGVAGRAAPHYLGGPGAGQRGCAAAGVCRCGLGDQHALPGGRSTAGRREGDGGQRCLCRRQRPFRGGQLRDAADRHQTRSCVCGSAGWSKARSAFTTSMRPRRCRSWGAMASPIAAKTF